MKIWRHSNQLQYPEESLENNCHTRLDLKPTLVFVLDTTGKNDVCITCTRLNIYSCTTPTPHCILLADKRVHSNFAFDAWERLDTNKFNAVLSIDFKIREISHTCLYHVEFRWIVAAWEELCEYFLDLDRGEYMKCKVSALVLNRKRFNCCQFFTLSCINDQWNLKFKLLSSQSYVRVLKWTTEHRVILISRTFRYRGRGEL